MTNRPLWGSPTGLARAFADDLRSFDVASVSGEAFCLSLGDGLGRAFEEFQRLTESFRAVETIFTGRELESLSEAIGEVRQTVTGMTGGLDAECDGIEGLVRLCQDLASRFDLIRRSVRTIAALATNSRVEAASIDSRSGEVSGFAQELVNLAVQAQKAIDGCCREQRALAATLKTSRSILIEFKQSHSGDLAVVERDLGHVDADLVEHRARTGAAACTLSGRAKDIASAIGTIVMDLQIGDSTRQRAEHALDTLAEAPSLHADPDDAAAAMVMACRLAALQLAGARDDFTEAAGSISNSLLKLSHQADEIVATAGEVGREKGGGQSFIEIIRGKLGTALDLSQRSGAARSQVDAAVAEMARSTESLDRQMRDLSELTVAMTMIGINAILKAKRVGTTGLGLGVIADQLRGAADTVVIEVNEVTPLLGKAVAQTRTLAEMFAGRRADRMDRGNALAGEALTRFAACDTEIRRSIDTLIQNGGRVARDLENAATRQDAHRASAAMDDLRERIEVLAASLSLELGRTIDLRAIEAAFAKRYTIADERTIHAAFWSAEGGLDLERDEAA